MIRNDLKIVSKKIELYNKSTAIDKSGVIKMNGDKIIVTNIEENDDILRIDKENKEIEVLKPVKGIRNSEVKYTIDGQGTDKITAEELIITNNLNVANKITINQTEIAKDSNNHIVIKYNDIENLITIGNAITINSGVKVYNKINMTKSKTENIKIGDNKIIINKYSITVPGVKYENDVITILSSIVMNNSDKDNTQADTNINTGKLKEGSIEVYFDRNSNLIVTTGGNNVNIGANNTMDLYVSNKILLTSGVNNVGMNIETINTKDYLKIITENEGTQTGINVYNIKMDKITLSNELTLNVNINGSNNTEINKSKIPEYNTGIIAYNSDNMNYYGKLFINYYGEVAIINTNTTDQTLGFHVGTSINKIKYNVSGNTQIYGRNTTESIPTLKCDDLIIENSGQMYIHIDPCNSKNYIVMYPRIEGSSVYLSLSLSTDVGSALTTPVNIATFTLQSTTITHTTYVDDNINDYYIGQPVYIGRKTYTRIPYGLSDKMVEYTNERVEDISEDCISSVKTEGTEEEFVGIITNISTRDNDKYKIVQHTGGEFYFEEPVIQYATHGDYVYRVPDTTMNYKIGDEITYKGEIIKKLGEFSNKEEDINIEETMKKERTIGKITGIINDKYVTIFKR